MEISIVDQIALDDALVAPAGRLKIGKCNLRLSSDVTSKEATLQVVYDVLKLTPFYKAFQILVNSGDLREDHKLMSIKLHQPWRSFAAIINKCLSGKPSYDSLRLSQAQILWDTTIKMKPPTVPKEKKEKKSGKGKQKTTELETIS
ncbi:hypothetical protein Tco_0631760 [Tanacetum coccineum]